MSVDRCSIASRCLLLACGCALLLLQSSFEAPQPVQEQAPPRTPTDLKPPAPVADGLPDELEGWKELDCARCHETIAREWASTRHALAWVDARYQEELADKQRPESCYACHIPEPIHAGKLGQKPVPRKNDTHFGVSCESCHLGSSGEMLGPFELQTAAHASKQSQSFLPAGDSALCIGCHATTVGPVIGIAKDFVESKQVEQGRSCVGCHMASVERAIANEPPATGSASEPASPPQPTSLPLRAGRSHALQTPRDPSFLRRAFRFEAHKRSTNVVLTIANECGHRVPGLIERSFRIEAELLTSDGKSVARATLTIDTRDSLAVDATRELVLHGEGARVRVRGLHEAPGLAEPVVFQEGVLQILP